MDNEIMYDIINEGIETKIKPLIEDIINNKEIQHPNPNINLELAVMYIKQLLGVMNSCGYNNKDPLYRNMDDFCIDCVNQIIAPSNKMSLLKNGSTFPEELLVTKVKDMYETYFPKTNQEPIQNKDGNLK